MLKSLPLYPTGKKNLIQNMELKLNYRKKIGKEANRKLQSNGKYPAIVYGGKENIPVYGSRSSYLWNRGSEKVFFSKKKSCEI